MRDFLGRGTRAVGWGLAALAFAAASGCRDILQVQNPQAFTSAAANSPTLLPAVAAGAEGSFQLSMATFSIM
ncbi:MAG: hypothetical protein KGL38_12515, partial [Gemmatimonadota bacterium]|nr:hypothetical protein [Gemmatimonadota bacterium]